MNREFPPDAAISTRGAPPPGREGDQRSTFLQRAGVLGAAALAGGAIAGAPKLVGAAAPTDADVRALNLVLLVEYAEAALYREALAAGSLRGELRSFADQVAKQEQDHISAVKKALGAKADPKPDFEFGNATRNPDRFARTAAELEDLAVAAYNGQATNLSKGVLEAAATIVSVEARHAAWVRSIVGEPPAPDATDKPATANEVLDGLNALGLRR
jgi:hypothetical protein